MASKIEWTNETWNPIVGCSLVSPGCTSCYAMNEAWRKSFNPKTPQYQGVVKKVNGHAVWTGEVHLVEHKLLAPLGWKRPRMVFVNSMSDLFHDKVPDEWIDQVFAVMALAPQHTFQVLTKRAERMRTYFADLRAVRDRQVPWMADLGGTYPKCADHELPLPNVLLGVSAERQQEATERIPDLLATPAIARFVSCEPLLGPVKLNAVFDHSNEHVIDVLAGRRFYAPQDDDGSPESRLDWVICGGESGPRARPMHPQWARGLRDQCKAAGVPFFFKQWGQWLPSTEHREPFQFEQATVLPDGSIREWDPDYPESRLIHPDMRLMIRVGKKAAGRLLDGVEHNDFPEVRR